ncbi:MAG: DUF58 domain-containing protein, partial [Bacteroidales bacterium]|nr:DUF58 domain-containing protein [Bacteroidales bacterium]
VINVYDQRERELPDIGLINVLDAETGNQTWVDTSSKAMRKAYSDWNKNLMEKTKQMLGRYRVESVSVSTEQDYVRELLKLFKSRT